MRQPRYRKAHQPLTADRIAEVVRLRDGGMTWKDVGRAMRLQETVCPRIYAEAKAEAARKLATGGHMAARGHGE